MPVQPIYPTPIFFGEVDNHKEINHKIKNIHQTLGGPWFKHQRLMGGELAAKWFSSRDEAMKLWD